MRHALPITMCLIATLAAALAAPTLTRAAQPEDAAEEQDQEQSIVYIEMKTTMGTLYLALNETKAPRSVENFVRYAEDGFYDGTIFHRVMDDFMIQGGGFTPGLEKKPTREPIENEWENGLKNTRGTIAMARLGGRADSATSQFFINLTDNGFLDRPRDGAGYAVFGRVVKGLDVLDTIAQVPVHREGIHGHVPDEPITIESVSVVSDDVVERKLDEEKDLSAQDEKDGEG